MIDRDKKTEEGIPLGYWRDFMCLDIFISSSRTRKDKCLDFLNDLTALMDY